MARDSTKVLAALAIATCTAAITNADDLNPPPWRGGALSVQAEWDWAQQPGNFFFMPPDTFSIVSGTGDPAVGPNGEFLYPGFDTHAEVDLLSNWTWDPMGGLFPHVPGGAGIAFNVQNWVDQEPEKLIRIQVAFLDLGLGAPTTDWVIGYIEPNGVFPGVQTGVYNEPGYWYEDWIIQPNPDWEQIALHVPQDTILLQVVIDTISIPAPATCVLFAIAPLAARRRRR